MLISVLELETFMGKEFTEAEELQAEATIQNVSYVIEHIVGFPFEYLEDDFIWIQADGHGIIDLSAKRIVDVSELINKDGDSISGWEWDGMGSVYGLFPLQVVGLTYSHGYEEVPRVIKSVALGMASRVMYNPAGLRQETVGAISVTYPGIGGEAGTINLSRLEREILEDFGRRAASMRLAITRKRIASLPILTLNNDVD